MSWKSYLGLPGQAAYLIDKKNPGMADIYRISVKGCLSNRWAEWFDGLSITASQNGTTTLVGPVVDQAALHGLLATIRDLGLPILSVTLLDPESHTIEGRENLRGATISLYSHNMLQPSQSKLFVIYVHGFGHAIYIEDHWMQIVLTKKE